MLLTPVLPSGPRGPISRRASPPTPPAAATDTGRAWRRWLPLLLAGSLAACATPSAWLADDKVAREHMLQTVWETLNRRHVAAPPAGWDTAIARHRAAVLAAPALSQDPEALWAALDRLAAEWQDAHTRVEGPRDIARQTRHEVVGLGFSLSRLGDDWIAHRVDRDGPAHAAGLRDGMRLLAWNGERPELVWARLQQRPRPSSTPQATLQRGIRRWLDGAPGTRVDTRWQAFDGSDLSLTAERKLMRRLPAWQLQRREGGIAVLRWTGFDTAIEAELTRTIAQLGAETRGLVLDLRGNGGGNFAMTQRLAAALLSGEHDGAIVGAKDEPGTPTRLDGRALYTGPVAVLQDRESASGSELLARTLQALGRARVIGETSCGCLAAVTRFVPLGPHGRLAVSERHIRWADGPVEGRGVQPDLPAARTLAGLRAGRDEPLEAAERWLRNPGSPP